MLLQNFAAANVLSRIEIAPSRKGFAAHVEEMRRVIVSKARRMGRALSMSASFTRHALLDEEDGIFHFPFEIFHLSFMKLGQSLISNDK